MNNGCDRYSRTIHSDSFILSLYKSKDNQQRHGGV